MTTITKAENCFLGCAYPLTRDDFFNSFDSKKDFVRIQLEPYKQYSKDWIWKNIYRDFTEKMTKELHLIEKEGVCVKRNLSLNQVNEIIGFSVFSLFTHHNKATGEIELFDGMHSKQKFKESFPNLFSGIVDLTACNSDLIRNELKTKISNQVIAFKVKLGILGLTLVYKHVVMNLKRNSLNYIDCYTQTIQDLFKKQ